VIDLELQEQGWVDGAFPPVTFDKISKKIVTLTETEIQTRLRKVLEKLSKTGCLSALLATFLDDCDPEVQEKATQVI